MVINISMMLSWTAFLLLYLITHLSSAIFTLKINENQYAKPPMYSVRGILFD